jgi:hypothetical protein
MFDNLLNVALVCATLLLLYIFIARFVTKLAAFLRVKHILVDLQLLLDSVWRAYSVKHIAPLFVVNGIESENLEELRSRFVREVLLVLSPSYKKFLLQCFTQEGFVIYIGKYFDSRLSDYLVEKEANNVGEIT